MDIRVDDLTGPEIADLLREHLENMHQISPPESVHALDLASLRSPDIAFWSVWDGRELVGCGALKELDAGSGEIKSMRTKPGGAATPGSSWRPVRSPSSRRRGRCTPATGSRSAAPSATTPRIRTACSW